MKGTPQKMHESQDPVRNRGALTASLMVTLRTEIRAWAPLAVLTFFLASLVMSGFPQGLIPETQYPFDYKGGDDVFFAWMTQRSLEGSFYENARNGYPFGSSMSDFPIPEVGNMFALKLFGEIFGSYIASVNLYFLLGFALTSVTAYGVLRTFGLWKSLAICGAILFAFLPFHFLRLSHLLLTWYFAIPIFFYLGAVLFFGGPNLKRLEGSPLHRTVLHFGMAILGMFGVYWSFFGGLLLGTAGLAGSLRTRSRRSLIVGTQLTASLLLGVILTVAPSFSYWAEHGRNPETAHRQAMEVDLYGLRISQLLLPRPDHRLPVMARVAQSYEETFPLVNENVSASLGILGSLGFAVLVFTGFLALVGVATMPRLNYLTTVTAAFISFATIGGFSTPFALLVTPMLRGWNRCSVFIGFACLAAILWVVQLAISRYAKPLRQAKVASAISGVLLVLGLLDQTTPPNPNRSAERVSFDAHRNFIGMMEQQLPAKSAVYQLPYHKSLEEADLHELSVYDVLLGMLHSHNLRWSLGGMKGREGDRFYRALAEQPLERQIETAKRLGFRAFYVDRRGYPDHGQAIESELTTLLGHGPNQVSSDGSLCYFQLPQGGELMEVSTPEEVYERSGFRPVAGDQR